MSDNHIVDCSQLGHGTCCQQCAFDEWDGHQDVSLKTIGTKYGKVDFYYCCKHSFTGEETRLCEILEKTLHDKQAEL